MFIFVLFLLHLMPFCNAHNNNGSVLFVKYNAIIMTTMVHSSFLML